MLPVSAVLALVRKSRLYPLSLSVVIVRSNSGTTSSLPLSRMSLPSLPIVSSVSPRVLRVLGCNPSYMTLQGTNTYVVGTGQRRVLIDTGEPDFPEYIKNLQETMIKYNFQLDHIIITHYHSDHIGGVNNVLDMITNKNECKVWKFNPPKTAKKRDYNFELNFVKDKQTFYVEGATLKIHYAPGHTADHIIITIEEDQSLFSADSVLGEGTTVFENLTEYLNSLQLILDLKPTIIFPGHGSVIKYSYNIRPSNYALKMDSERSPKRQLKTTHMDISENNLKILTTMKVLTQDPIDRVNNYIKHRLEREFQIYELINNSPEKSMSEEDIVNTMYSNLSDHYKEATLYITRKHLIKLFHDGKLQNTTNENEWAIWEK